MSQHSKQSIKSTASVATITNQEEGHMSHSINHTEAQVNNNFNSQTNGSAVTTHNTYDSHEFSVIQYQLNSTGRGKTSNVYTLFYRVCTKVIQSRHSRAYHLNATRECRFYDSHYNTIGNWLSLLVEYGLVTTRKDDRGNNVMVTEKGWAFLDFVRDGEPLCIDGGQAGYRDIEKNPIVKPIVKPTVPTLYTDSPNDINLKEILLSDVTCVDKLPEERVVGTKLPQASVEIINSEIANRKADQKEEEDHSSTISRISTYDAGMFKKRLEDENITVKAFLYAWFMYRECRLQFHIESPLGFIINRCRDEMRLLRDEEPQLNNELASLIAQSLVNSPNN